MTLDADVVRGRCQEIEQSLERLERIRAGGREGFLTDRDTQDIACYRLLVAIEAALALCYHVSARQSTGRSIMAESLRCWSTISATFGNSPEPLRP